MKKKNPIESALGSLNPIKGSKGNAIAGAAVLLTGAYLLWCGVQFSNNKHWSWTPWSAKPKSVTGTTAINVKK